MRINLDVDTGGLDRLVADLAAKPAETVPVIQPVVVRATREALGVMQGLARSEAGPHGKHYADRISAGTVGPLTGEAGPRAPVIGNAVGGGWRNGPPNTDAQKTADLMGPRFAAAVGDAAGGLFW